MAITKNSQIDLNGNEMILDADGDTTITADTDDQIDFKTAGSDRVTIDSSGEVGVGTTAPNDYDNNAAGISSNLVVKDSGHSGIIVISGTSSDAAISFGDGTGTDAYRGAVAYVNSADALYFKAGGNNKLRLDSDGLKFGSDTAAANALDDYEEGTWTPSFLGATGIAYTSQTGYYAKIGSVVTIMFQMVVSTAPTSGANIYIQMPFNPKGSGTGFAGTTWNRITGGTNSSAIQAVTNLHEYSTSANFYSYNITSGTVYSSYTHYNPGVYSATITYQID
jgi:hypothetical protein